MKKVYTSETAAMCWHMRNVLEQHGIDAVLQREQLFSASGEVPFTECMSEVWVKHDLDFQRAQRLIREMETATEETVPDWICRNCSEQNGGSFAICWNCESSDDL